MSDTKETVLEAFLIFCTTDLVENLWEKLMGGKKAQEDEDSKDEVVTYSSAEYQYAVQCFLNTQTEFEEKELRVDQDLDRQPPLAGNRSQLSRARSDLKRTR